MDDEKLPDIDIDWEREAAWLAIQEAVGRQQEEFAEAYDGIDTETLMDRCREIFDVVFMDMTPRTDGEIRLHLYKLLGFAMARESHILRLESLLRDHEVTVPPCPPWDLEKPRP